MACEAMLRDLRANITERCGKKTEWLIRPIDIRAEFQDTPKQFLDKPIKACTRHLGDLVAKASGVYPTFYYEIRQAGMYD